MGRDEKDEQWDKYVRRIGHALLQLERYAPGGQGKGLLLTEVRFKLDADNRTSVLVVLKAERGEERLVGFVGGADLSSVTIAAAKKILADAVRWREDRPWAG